MERRSGLASLRNLSLLFFSPQIFPDVGWSVAPKKIYPQNSFTGLSSFGARLARDRAGKGGLNMKIGDERRCPDSRTVYISRKISDRRCSEKG
jgi:hypothetical protein